MEFTLPTAKKEAEVTEILELFERSKGIILTDFTGINVAAMTDLRARLREASCSYLVVKNRLTAIAADRAGYAPLRDYLTGPTGIVTTEEDPLAPAKVLADFAKKELSLKIKGGIVEETLYTGVQVEQLASIPPRDVLLSQLVSSIQGPIAGLAMCLNGVLQKLVGTLHSLAEKRQEEEGSA